MQALQFRIFMSFVLVFLISTSLYLRDNKTPFSGVPVQEQKQLQNRLTEYVQTYRTHDWSKLYDLISDTAKRQVKREKFVVRMNAEHREDFSSFPDLLEFDADHTVSSGENQFDIYGCGKARREQNNFNGIALVHAVFEHKDWYFSGWSFTGFPNEPCKLLKDPSWQPPDPMEWDMPMGELRNEPGPEFHTDKPK